MAVSRNSRFLNRHTIMAIHEVARRWPGRTCQTNSRLNGNYLVAVRLYARYEDAGHPERADAELRTYGDMLDWLAAHPTGRDAAAAGGA